MCKELEFSIVERNKVNGSILYQLSIDHTYIVSNPDVCELLCQPEIVGHQISELLLQPIVDILGLFYRNGELENVNLMYILRGGLNFPIEEACCRDGICIKGVSFLTSERVFLDNQVSRIESTYRKVIPIDRATVIIGDIVASGETLKNAIKYVEEQYAVKEKEIKRIVVFAIGTINTLKAIEELGAQLKKRWNNFEGVWAVFFEGIFSTYADSGITNCNLQRVDFIMAGGFLSPEYRSSIFSHPYSAYEKCPIYDGGARRFEQIDHIHSIMGYWRKIMTLPSEITPEALLSEKLGYCFSIGYEDWKQMNHYECINESVAQELYEKEKTFVEQSRKESLLEIAKERLQVLRDYYMNSHFDLEGIT